ncbi:hypothetical protein VNI00_007634 [Paramarasmius palmivorus]|uniref:Uncharacterized protein n=1 Tax=Paramarasmius palmivorus TaxID=297713 RepID=A0AAW0D3A3_9AGAR
MSTKTNGKTNTNGSLSTKSNGTSPTTPPKPKKHTLASLWFTLTLPVILWDASYCFLRPRSMFGGDLHYIWKPYSIYQNVDLVYGVRTYEEAARGEGGGFTNAQSLMNLLETGGNLCYLLGMNGFIGSPDLRMRWVLIGFLSAGLTLAKTVLYWAQEYYCNFCAIGHNDLKTLILFWVIPNGLWIVFPSFIVWTLGKDLVRWLDWAERKAMDVKGK